MAAFGSAPAAGRANLFGWPAEQARVLRGQHAVALASGFLQGARIGNGDQTAPENCQASPLQRSGGKGDGGAPYADHLRQKLVGERKRVLVHALVAHQQPTRHAFLGRV
jgi:hypothetical protein